MGFPCAKWLDAVRPVNIKSAARHRRLTACLPLGAAILLHRPQPPPSVPRVSRASPARGAARALRRES